MPLPPPPPAQPQPITIPPIATTRGSSSGGSPTSAAAAATTPPPPPPLTTIPLRTSSTTVAATTTTTTSTTIPTKNSSSNSPKTTSSNKDSKKTSSGGSTSSPDEGSLLEGFDVSALTTYSKTVMENMFSGDFGKRGEGYVATQFVLLFCIGLGNVPVIGGLLGWLLGPGLLLAGIGVIVTGMLELGNALTPWPTPSPNYNEGLIPPTRKTLRRNSSHKSWLIRLLLVIKTIIPPKSKEFKKETTQNNECVWQLFQVKKAKIVAFPRGFFCRGELQTHLRMGSNEKK